MLTNVRLKNTFSPRKRQAANSSGPTAKYSVPVVRRTFHILEELARSQQLGLKEITQNTGIAKSTAFRILNTLTQIGYVIRDVNRDYRISTVLGRLVNEESLNEELRRLALPLMLELRNQFGETVNLGMQQFDKVTYIEVVPSEFALRLQESRGTSIPMHASALGKAILAFSPKDVVERRVRHHQLEILTPNTITQPEDFLAEIRRVRTAGFAFDRGEGSLLAVCIAAPILDTEGNAVAAVSISGPASRFNPKRDSVVITSLLKASAELSRAVTRILNPS